MKAGMHAWYIQMQKSRYIFYAGCLSSLALANPVGEKRACVDRQLVLLVLLLNKESGFHLEKEQEQETSSEC